MKHLLERVASAMWPGAAAPHRGARAGVYKVYARIEEPLMAERRMKKYQHPLHSALMLARQGHVTSGGSVQGTDGTIQWISIEMVLKDLDGALHFACGKLRELGAPAGSVVKFQRAGTEVVLPIR